MAICLAAGAWSAPAAAEFGEGFGFVPGTFWAGTCDLPSLGGGPYSSLDPATAREARDCHASSALQPQTAVPVTQAGAHPDATSTFEFKPNGDPVGTSYGPPYPDGTVKDIVVDLPPGLVGNPESVPKCGQTLWALGRCPVDTQIGVVEIRLTGIGPSQNPQECGGPDQGNFPQFAYPSTTLFPTGERRCRYPILNVEAPHGSVAALGFTFFTGINVYFEPIVRTDGDFGIRLVIKNVPESPTLSLSTATIWGVPGDPSHDAFRNAPGLGVSPGAEWPASTPVKPFLTLQTACDGQQPRTSITVNSWQNPAVFNPGDPADYRVDSPPVTGCDQVPFDPSVSVQPTVTERDSATGLDVELDVPQEGLEDPNVLATSHVDKTVVELPEGVSVNPSGATGLDGCSDDEIGLVQEGNPPRFDNGAPACPDGSKIGTVSVLTPLLSSEGPGAANLTGTVYLGDPKSTDPQSGKMLRLFLVLESEARGVLAKIHGTATADPQTGRLKATFDKNPQVPFSNLRVHLKGGPHGVLATPQGCGTRETAIGLTPWSATGGGLAVDLTDGFTVGGDCSLGFAPNLAAGMSEARARGTGSFSFRLLREDGEQWVDGLTAQLPQGLLARVKDVPLCADAQAAAGVCPAASRIGTVDATAGSGDPFVLERKGDAYLTEGYKGCAYGLMVSVPVIAGPFDGRTPARDLGEVVVRQSVCVDRSTAAVTVTSDSLPTIWHGIPLRLRSVTVKVDRPGFMLNPSDCTPSKVAASIVSVQGAVAKSSAPFAVARCGALPFKPRLGLTLTGRKQKTSGKHPGVKAVVKQTGTGEAGIEKAKVTLPRSLALDSDNAKALCEFVDGTKPDLENHCPAGSIVGRARARTPLLENDLVGNVYFVKNIRRDPRTGNPIRTLPMLVAALRGEIAINLKGESDTTGNGRLVNTFASVPDAPISQFNMNIKGGRNGILLVTENRRGRINICRSRQVAQAEMDGQNGRRRDFDIRVKTPCAKKSKARQGRKVKKRRRR